MQQRKVSAAYLRRHIKLDLLEISRWTLGAICARQALQRACKALHKAQGKILGCVSKAHHRAIISIRITTDATRLSYVNLTQITIQRRRIGGGAAA